MTSPWPKTVDGLLLRDACPEDVDRMLAFRNLPEANRWMIHTHHDPEEFRATWAGMADDENELSCVAELDGQVVGIGFLDLETGMGQPGVPERTDAMIGYFVDPAFAGRGVGTRIARGLLAACFEDLGVRRVTAGAFADNVASWWILERVGMRREQHGVQDSWHAELGWVDGVTYGMLREEWPRG